jgi:predicted metalloendopeptidase
MERLFSFSKSPEEGGTYFENTKNMAKWRYEEDLADLNKPVDKTRWGMSPQTVNAYYNASYNEIVQQLFYNRHFIITKQTKR